MSERLISVQKIFGYLQFAGEADYIGEPISQLEHALQAAHFAEKAGADQNVILACLFHDIGHLCAASDAPQMDGLGVKSHEKIGADFIRSLGFPEKIASLVESHVDAKRYLASQNESYLKHLSQASRQTLDHQGGVMSQEESERFENQDLFKEMILLRKCDEASKRTDIIVRPLEYYFEMAIETLK